MTTFNPLSVRTFVAHRQLQRKTRARFRAAVGILLSLLLHAGLLWYILTVTPDKQPEGTTTSIQAPLMITLQQSKAPPSAIAPSPNPPEPVRSIKPPKPRTPKAARRSEPTPTPRPVAPPLVRAPNAAPAPQATDISSLLSAARARRQQAAQAEQADESDDDDTVSDKSDKAPSGNAVAQANINFSIRRNKGFGGIFEITSIGPRIGIFRFYGWTVDAGNSTRQTITVDAGLGGDVQMAVIARMIALIREHYKGTFSWNSQRLGRVVKLSARPEDEPGLREFMRKEMFEDQHY